jgi:Domain of unknown function (DUF1929)
VDFVGSRIVLVFDPDEVDLNQPFQTTNGPGMGKPWRSLFTSASPSSSVSLHHPRWYPSCVMVPPRDMGNNPFVYISVAGGVVTYDDSTIPIIPASDPAHTTQELLKWSLLTGAITLDNRSSLTPPWLYPGPTTPAASGLSFFYYPRLFAFSERPARPDGELWMASMTVQSASSDPVNTPNGWTNHSRIPATPNMDLIEEPMAVPVPAVIPSLRDGILVMGGAQIDNTHASHGLGVATSQCWFLDTRAASPTWLPFFPMQKARKFGNAVLLPDASMLVVGGGTNPGHGVNGGEQTEAEWFQGGQWRLLSNQATGRTYHSVAILLADGRVLSAGGNTCHAGAEYEIFDPPYLQAGNRPVWVNDPPAVIRYGEVFGFEIDLPFGQRADSVVLMRPGATTHGQDASQRYERLFEASPPIVHEVNYTYVQSPANPTVLGPGYCMMFVVSNGVPSIGRWVQLMP